jgi:diguanylate cyclase (GGDEF)-like protein
MSARRFTPQIVSQAFDWLPKGQSLPEGLWRTRHRALSRLLWAHVAGIFVYAQVRGFTIQHSLLEAGIVGLFAFMAHADRISRRMRSAMAAIGLVTASAVLVHVSGGVIELHFHFFVMVGILTLYQDWVPFLCAIGFVVFHHGVMGTISPSQVYNHPDAIAHPFKWAFIHGAFVLAASAASIVAWRLNEEQALKDSLTGLPNRRLFQDRVTHALTRQRNPANMAVLFIDLDGFKDVNDSLGHAAGDQVLTVVAARIRSILRPGDTPARLGGDEFAVLVEEIGSADGAAKVAQRLLDALSIPVDVRGHEMSVGASIGIALAEPGISTDELLRNADVAMYTAKQAGRGRFEPFEPGMHAKIVRRVDLERELHVALERGELELHYQPTIMLGTGRVCGMEALLRWNHPDRGLLYPADFLELAEANGSIVKIGSWVLREALAKAQEWKHRYPEHRLTMSVNLSPRQLFESDIVELVRSSLAETDLAPESVVLELTEGVMVRDTRAIIDRLNSLKALGVRLAVDDFGTGYSSLSYLRRLPFDILKIDKMFIDGVGAGPTESAFALAIIKLAQTLRLEMVAEGVEDVRQAVLLRDLGCELAQGYHFSRPLPADGIEVLLGARSQGVFV